MGSIAPVSCGELKPGQLSKKKKCFREKKMFPRKKKEIEKKMTHRAPWGRLHTTAFICNWITKDERRW
jgi:hypothetical protein